MSQYVFTIYLDFIQNDKLADVHRRINSIYLRLDVRRTPNLADIHRRSSSVCIKEEHQISPMFNGELIPSVYKKNSKPRHYDHRRSNSVCISQQHQISPMFNGELIPSAYKKNTKSRCCSMAK